MKISVPTPLNRQQILGFWASWSGWMLDGMDSVIYALVLSPALKELLPQSGMANGPADIAFAGSILFALFLMGWGFSFLWGPIADRFGRTKCLAASILIFSVFTGAAALSHNVWELGLFRFLAGTGIGGEWAMAGTYVAEAWPEDRRKAGAGYLQTGYYAGFFLAAALNFTVGARYGWRAMFLCGAAPVAVALFTLMRVREPVRWQRAHATSGSHPLRMIFSPEYIRRTVVNTLLVSIAIIGLWAGTVYEPTALLTLAKNSGYTASDGTKIVSAGTAILSIGTILGCLLAPVLAERFGRKKTLAGYFAGMAIAIFLAFGWAFYLPNGLVPFVAILFFLGLSGGNFAIFSLWLPEQYTTQMRATAFAFCTSFGRFLGAGANFAIAAMIQTGSLGHVIALTAIPFVAAMAIIPFARETRGQALP
ncbi:MAG TPA: MFS transporter [Rhizomicrobium sp.]|nr:MFS transporter [Rhizomicrobium sp.]